MLDENRYGVGCESGDDTDIVQGEEEMQDLDPRIRTALHIAFWENSVANRLSGKRIRVRKPK